MMDIDPSLIRRTVSSLCDACAVSFVYQTLYIAPHQSVRQLKLIYVPLCGVNEYKAHQCTDCQISTKVQYVCQVL